jgi:epsilon-lactone hydrolase
MTAIALDLAGVSVTAMQRETPLVRHLLREARWQFDRTVWGRVIAFELKRAMAISDPARRVARHAALRERYRRVEARHTSLMDVATAGLRVERACPSGPALSRIDGPDYRDDGVLLYVPGGSFLVERSPQLTGLIARIAREAEINAVICDYRLAPENPCPAAIEDVETAFELLVAKGFAAHRIVMIAESTGGGIALAAAQRLVARGRMPGGIALLSPWIDCDPGSPHLDPVTRQCARLYLNGADPRDPRCNPIHGPMRGLPPISIHANRGDAIFADAEALARRAAAAGVQVELRYWPGRLHVLERHDDADARRSIAEIAGFIDRRLAPLREAA